MNNTVLEVTQRIRERSKQTREDYLLLTEEYASRGVIRSGLSCTNLAHNYAAAENDEKLIFTQQHRAANIGIISAYNDVLSAHAPYKNYPDRLKEVLKKAGGVGQMAGGVPAMCDGVTQGQEGMELSLFSRDVIALSASVALSHQVFDGVLMLGICDKIVPGLLMAALRFGHIPCVFVPAGPMPSGISNTEKSKIRQQFARGEVGEDALLKSEMASYHSSGTCTFYGTANSNQVLMELLGVQLPGSSFVNPANPLREKLTDEAAHRILSITALTDNYKPVAQIVDERAIVNAMVGLLASGGSTNHSIHLIAIARMAGLLIDWQDLSDLSAVTPLLTRMYPNGAADVNAFQEAGGMAVLVRELNELGLLHMDAQTILDGGLETYLGQPTSDADGRILWKKDDSPSRNLDVLAHADKPFLPEGGMRLLEGNLGRSMIKVSAIPDDRWSFSAPARVFENQNDVLKAYKANELNQDVAVVLRKQGPKANGMPELHKLMPALTNLQEDGYKVILITDGRLSGASGKIPAAIHLSPEALSEGAIAKVIDGDEIELNAQLGSLNVLTSDFADRPSPNLEPVKNIGVGRELFASLRGAASSADSGAISLLLEN